MNLGRTVAVVYKQRFSPCFVVAHSIDTGEEVGRYVHPGRLETGAVIDLDGDGAPELLLGGTENTFAPHRPVVVALDPARLVGSASTVQWRTVPGEDALARSVYQVYLRGDLRPRESGSVYLGTNELLLWDKAGLAREFTAQLDEEIVVLSSGGAYSSQR